jgi:hypothetical protein
MSLPPSPSTTRSGLRSQIIQHERQPAFAGRRRIARHAGIVHPRFNAVLADKCGLQLRRKPFVRGEAVSGVQAVPERHDQLAARVARPRLP